MGRTEDVEMIREQLHVNTKSSCSSNRSIFSVSECLQVAFKKGASLIGYNRNVECGMCATVPGAKSCACVCVSLTFQYHE